MSVGTDFTGPCVFFNVAPFRISARTADLASDTTVDLVEALGGPGGGGGDDDDDEG